MKTPEALEGNKLPKRPSLKRYVIVIGVAYAVLFLVSQCLSHTRSLGYSLYDSIIMGVLFGYFFGKSAWKIMDAIHLLKHPEAKTLSASDRLLARKLRRLRAAPKRLPFFEYLRVFWAAEYLAFLLRFRAKRTHTTGTCNA